MAAYEGKFIVRFGAKNSRFPQVCSASALSVKLRVTFAGGTEQSQLPAAVCIRERVSAPLATSRP